MNKLLRSAALIGLSFCAIQQACAQQLPVLRVGYISSVDQVAVSVAISQGMFEKQGIDVKLSRPFPSGVDLLNAMQSGALDIGAVGAPLIGAVLTTMDVVSTGVYSGAADHLHADDPYAIVANRESGIDLKNPATLKGKKFAVTFGSTNQLYLTKFLAAHGLAESDVQTINTAPTDMTVALQTKGADAIAIWEPWPSAALRDVAGSAVVQRGGAYTPNVNFQVVQGKFYRDHADLVQKYMLARDEATLWIRKHPKQAAQTAAQWYPNLKGPVLEESMKSVVKIMNTRVSLCTYLDIQEMTDFVVKTRHATPPADFDILKSIDPTISVKLASDHPELFADLPPIPSPAVISKAGQAFDQSIVKKACTR